MKEILSNEEIDSLLEMFRSEGGSGEGTPGELALGAKGPAVNGVDLLKPNRLSRDHMRSLVRMFESGGKALAAVISDRLRLEMMCDCVAVEQVRFQSWLSLLGGPVAIYVLKTPPFELPVMVTVTTSLLYGAVDRILGGSGKIQRVPTDFSAAEWVVADAFLGPCLDRLCDCLEEMVKLTWTIENRFTNPSLAQILPSQDVVLSVHFQASGEYLLGDLRLAMPYVSLEPHLKALDLGPGSRFRHVPGTLRDTLARTVAPVPVELSVILGEATLPLRQLLSLAVGDVVPLRKRVGESLVAPVQGVPKFAGQVGRQGNRLAFQVASLLKGR